MRVTIKEVAREAGVSTATVSRVLNRSGPVSEETSRRIREIAARLHYTPNEAARALKGSRTSTIGVLLPDLHGEFFSEVIRGIDQRARQDGFHLLLSGSHDDPGEMEVALGAMRGRVDGMLIMTSDAAMQARLHDLPTDLPVVLLNSARRDARIGVVAVDNAGGARAMTRHLLGTGHRRIAMIKGVERNHDAAERLKGYRAVLREAGAEHDPGWELPGDFTEAGGYAAAEALLARGGPAERRPSAIFAANDSMAIGALAALRDAGLQIPRDVSVAGFDDIPIARHITPPLTSVHVPIDELGRLATERLLQALSLGERYRPRRDVLPTRLVVRASCGAEPSRPQAAFRLTTPGRGVPRVLPSTEVGR